MKLNLFLFSPEREQLYRVPQRGALKLPNGDHVFCVTNGWSNDEGYHVAHVEPVPVAVDAADELADWRENVVIDAFQAHATLAAWGIRDQVAAIVADVGEPLSIAYEYAPKWTRASPAINQLLSLVVLSNGKPMTQKELDRFFREAEGVSV